MYLVYFREDPLYPSVDPWTEFIKRNTSPWNERLSLTYKKSIAQVGQCWSSGRTADQPLFFSVRRGRKTPKHPVVFQRFYELSCSIERASLAATKKQTHTQQESCTYNNYFMFFNYDVHVFYLSTDLPGGIMMGLKRMVDWHDSP